MYDDGDGASSIKLPAGRALVCISVTAPPSILRNIILSLFKITLNNVMHNRSVYVPMAFNVCPINELTSICMSSVILNNLCQIMCV